MLNDIISVCVFVLGIVVSCKIYGYFVVKHYEKQLKIEEEDKDGSE